MPNTPSLFDNHTPLSPVRCRLRVPARTYRWLDSLTLQDIQELRPCEKRWGRADQKELHRKLRDFLAQTATADGAHIIVQEEYRSQFSGFAGRLFSRKGCQGLYQPLRAHILSETADLDQSCAMQRILLWTCTQFHFTAPHLQRYVEHREECLNGLMQSQSLTKSAAKECFQIAWTSCKRLRGTKDRFLREYDEEAKRLQCALMQVDVLRWILPFCDTGKANLEGRLCLAPLPVR